MARTIQVIYDAILTEKAATAELAGLTSTSNTAIWRLWAWVMAAAIHLHETLWDAFKIEVEEIAASAVPGTASWYADQCKKYQDGGTLVVTNYRAGYAAENASAQIVKQAAVIEQGGGLLFKVAKSPSGAALQPLSSPEQSGLTSYLNKIKFAGTEITLLSAEGDAIRVNGGVFYYDPIYSLDEVKADLDAKVSGLLQGLPFNGVLYRNRLIDALQSALGYVDFTYTSFEVRSTPSAGTSWAVLDRKYNPFSGYLLPETDFSAQITFVADVQS